VFCNASPWNSPKLVFRVGAPRRRKYVANCDLKAGCMCHPAPATSTGNFSLISTLNRRDASLAMSARNQVMN